MNRWDQIDQRANDRAAILRAALTHYGITPPGGGGDQRIRCPLGTHDDTHPSATINLTTGLWNCFTCSEGGDGYTLIMAREGCTFREAQQTLDDTTDGNSSEVRGQLDPGMGYLPRRKGNPVKRRPGGMYRYGD